MTARTYLEQAIHLDARIRSQLQAKQSLKQLAGSLSDTALPGTDPILQPMQQLTLVEQHLNRDLARMIELKGKLLDAIQSLSNPNEQLVLRYRYLEGYTLDEIAGLLRISRSTAYRIHRDAIRHFVVPT